MSDVQTGMDFAESLYALVHSLGPKRYSVAEKEALGQALVACAIDWVRRHPSEHCSSAEPVERESSRATI